MDTFTVGPSVIVLMTSSMNTRQFQTWNQSCDDTTSKVRMLEAAKGNVANMYQQQVFRIENYIYNYNLKQRNLVSLQTARSLKPRVYKLPRFYTITVKTIQTTIV